jgi:hypothetical protein
MLRAGAPRGINILPQPGFKPVAQDGECYKIKRARLAPGRRDKHSRGHA